MVSHRHTVWVLPCTDDIMNKHHSATLLDPLCSLFLGHMIWEVPALNKTQALHNREPTCYGENTYMHCQWEGHRLSWEAELSKDLNNCSQNTMTEVQCNSVHFLWQCSHWSICQHTSEYWLFTINTILWSCQCIISHHNSQYKERTSEKDTELREHKLHR